MDRSRKALAGLAAETMKMLQKVQSEAAKRVLTKGKGDIATEGDLRAEEFLLKHLEQLFPGVAVLTEERGFIGPAGDPLLVVDPLDGSTNFHRGHDHFAVSIALLDKGMPVLSAAAVGERNEIYTAQAGQGAYLNDQSITVSSTPLHHLSMVALQSNFKKEVPPYLEWVYQHGGKVRNYGSAVSHLCQIASRRMDLCIIRQLKLWDFAAAGHILLEAGGFLSNFQDEPLFPRTDLTSENWTKSYSLIASNGAAHGNLPKDQDFLGSENFG